jgi:DNA-binding transcriptional LysR family regulator
MWTERRLWRTKARVWCGSRSLLRASRALAPRLGKFLAAYPELSVEIVGRDRLGDLVADGFDAAVRFGEPEPSALVARRLLETRVQCDAKVTFNCRSYRFHRY